MSGLASREVYPINLFFPKRIKNVICFICFSCFRFQRQGFLFLMVASANLRKNIWCFKYFIPSFFTLYQPIETQTTTTTTNQPTNFSTKHLNTFKINSQVLFSVVTKSDIRNISRLQFSYFNYFLVHLFH